MKFFNHLFAVGSLIRTCRYLGNLKSSTPLSSLSHDNFPTMSFHNPPDN